MAQQTTGQLLPPEPRILDSLDRAKSSHTRIRPVAAPPSTILEEIEVLIPDLSENANALRSQADILHDYCNALEERQVEMKRIVETAFVRARKMQGQSPMGTMCNPGPSQEAPMAGNLANSDVFDMRPN